MSHQPSFTGKSGSEHTFLGLALAWLGSAVAAWPQAMTRHNGVPAAFNDHLRRDIGLSPIDEDVYWRRFR